MKNIETIASETLKALYALKNKDANHEASRLGEILGNYRRGRVGDCLLQGAINSAKSRFGI